MATSSLLVGKRALVVGLLNKHSIAASITHSLLAHGASCMVASRSPLSESQIKACAFELPFASHHHHRHGATSPPVNQSLHFSDCDVENDESVASLMSQCEQAFNGELDILVHSVAFAPRETFHPKGTLMASRAAWNQALDVSAYSLIALTRAAHPLLSAGEPRDRSVLALSYAGASKIVPNYNVMGPAKAALEATARQLAYELGEEGIRVNCLSPGPMNTVSARGIPGISKMRKYAEEHSPLRRNATGTEVGELAAFLASNAAASITGQTLYVDGGLSIMAPYARDPADGHVMWCMAILQHRIISITTETMASAPPATADDPNASLGIRLSDVDAETPPNLFMYPRSFINMHREGSFYPFLAVYPPQLLQFVQPNPILESCAGKFFLSAAMGYGMGNVFGLVLGSYEGITPPIPVPGQRELPKVPWREAMTGSWRVTKGKCRYWGNNFLVISSMFSGLECAVEKARGVHDVGNELVAGCATGAALAAGQGWQAQCLGCAGFAAFSYAIHTFTDGKF